MKMNENWKIKDFHNQVLLPNGYVVAYTLTIFSGIRVVVGHNDSLVYNANWCCGKDSELARVIHRGAQVIFSEVDELSMTAPLASTIKPLDLDEEFLEWFNEAIKQRLVV